MFLKYLSKLRLIWLVAVKKRSFLGSIIFEETNELEVAIEVFRIFQGLEGEVECFAFAVELIRFGNLPFVILNSVLPSRLNDSEGFVKLRYFDYLHVEERNS